MKRVSVRRRVSVRELEEGFQGGTFGIMLVNELWEGFREAARGGFPGR